MSGTEIPPIKRVKILPHEFRRDTGWKVHDDGLLESPEGRTVFPSIHPLTGEEIGQLSYYLENVDIQPKNGMAR